MVCEEAGRLSIGLAHHSEVAAQNNGQKRREARQKLQKAESLCRENGHPPPGDTPKIVYLSVCVCVCVCGRVGGRSRTCASLVGK